jgi:3-dehydroquinate synthetase
MRGIELVSMPTSLLAMVDASVGGKTAVNLRAGKNLAGAFHDPRQVFIETQTLATLPDEEYRSGLGEVVKTMIIAGQLDWLVKHIPHVKRRDPEFLAELVHDCVAVKAQVVARDPFEKNLRKHLNLGHTFAHGIERAAGYGRIPHGIAVGVGLALAIRTARAVDKLIDEHLESRTHELLAGFGMPASLAELRTTYDTGLQPAEIVKAMRHDKKSKAGKIRLVLPVASRYLIHDVVVEEPVLLDVLSAG